MPGPTSSQSNAYNAALATGKGVLSDQIGNTIAVGAQMAAGATSGGVLTSDASGNLTNQPLPSWGMWNAADYGLLDMTAPVEASGSSSGAITAGTVYLVQLKARSSYTVTNIVFRVGVTASGASTGSFVGLYSSAGVLLSGSSDIGVLTPGIKTIALTTPQLVTAGQFYWIAIVTNNASTQPAINSFAGAAAGIVNWSLTAATLRCAVAATGQTSLPSSFTPSSLTSPAALPLHFAVS